MRCLRFLLEETEILVVRVKSRPEMWEREVFQMEMPGLGYWGVERRPAGNERLLREERETKWRVERNWSLGMVRLWRVGRLVIQIDDTCERRGREMVVRAGRDRM